MRMLAVAVAAMLAAGGCGDRASAPAVEQSERPAAAPWFTERAAEVGLAFVHVNGMSGKFYDVEIFGPGVALFDFDNDDDLDAYVVQGQPLGGEAAAGDLRDRLFRNDVTVDANGIRTLRFTDVTTQARIDVRSYG